MAAPFSTEGFRGGGKNNSQRNIYTKAEDVFGLACKIHFVYVNNASYDVMFVKGKFMSQHLHSYFMARVYCAFWGNRN